MAHLQRYKSIRPLNKSVMIRIDDQLFMAIMAYAQEQTDIELLNCPEMIRAVMAAVCLDKTFVHISNQNILQTGNTYYTESDIEGYESQIETLKSRVSEYANELGVHQKVWGNFFLIQLISLTRYLKMIILKKKCNCPTLFDALVN